MEIIRRLGWWYVIEEEDFFSWEFASSLSLRVVFFHRSTHACSCESNQRTFAAPASYLSNGDLCDCHTYLYDTHVIIVAHILPSFRSKHAAHNRRYL